MPQVTIQTPAATAQNTRYDGVILIDPDTGLPYKAGTSSNGGGTGVDRELTVSDYKVKTSFTGGAVGETIRSIASYDVSGGTITPVGSTIWRNESTDTVLGGAPLMANLEPPVTTGITNAQMVAALAGIATGAKQDAGNASLVSIANAVATAATAARQDTGNTSLAAIATSTAAGATAAKQDTLQASIGAPADAAAASDTATAGVIAFIKRILGNQTTLLARIPTAGVKASAAAHPVVLASDDAQIGTKVTAVTALPTGGTGIIGWLSNIWSSVATSALQTTGNTSLATIATNTGSGATAARQDTGNTSLAAIATSTAAGATAARQDTGNTSLAAIATATAGGATAANQTAANASLASIDAKTGNTFAVTTSLTRPADTTAYSPNDALANAAGTVTVLAGIARQSGGSGLITDMVVTSSNDPALPLQGEVWIFDSTVTQTADNALMNPALADRLKLVAVVPFMLQSIQGGTGVDGSFAYLSGLNVSFKAVGSADLVFMVKVKNAYTPASGEVISVRAKGLQTS